MSAECTWSSDSPAQCEGLPLETLAALELGFKNLLMELDPEKYSPKATPVTVQKHRRRGTPAEIGRAIRASDLAFPTRNYIPNAPLKVMRMKTDDFQNAQREAQLNDAKGTRTTALMRFGGGVHSFVMCDLVTRAVLHAHPLYAVQLHTEPHASAVPFGLADFPGRGTGLVASRRIKEGECILREPPLIITISGMAYEEALAFEQSAEHDMDPRARKALDALYDCHADDPPELQQPGGPRARIVRTNKYSVQFPTAPKDLAFGGTFEIISRFNHSCAANVVFDWSFLDFQGSMWATRDIQSGEELTSNYLSDILWNAPRETRRQELFRMYRFHCACLKCGPV